MAQLPVYRQQGNINAQVGQIRDLDTFAQGAKNMQSAGNMLFELSAKWQASKDAVENLDGKNKLNSGISAILDEASNYNDYSTPEELSQKQNELTQKMNELVPNIVGGFSNNQTAREFEANGQFATQQNIYKLQSIFRDKQIDMGRAGLVESQNTNMENFISTGNVAFKDTYLNDLDSMVKSGIVDREYAAKMKQSTDKWDVYHVLRQAESDPDAVIKNLKSGAYNIKPEYMNDLLGDLNRIKTNTELMRNYEQLQNQNKGEDEATNYIYSNASYDEKLKYINEQEFLGNISESFATQARRNIKQFRPESEDYMSSAESISDIMERAYDLNVSDISDSDYLKGIKNLREEINLAQERGDLSTKDAVKLNKQLANATNKRTAEATQEVASGFGAAKDYIDKTLPAELRAEAYRSVFYATADKDVDNMNKTQQQQLYYNAAIQAVQGINTKNRNQALQISRPARIGDTWQGHKINSLYGRRERPTAGASMDHKGIDLSYRNNENIGAFAGGKVVKVVNDQGKSKKGYGNYVDIKGYDGTIHRYAHANKITVKVGQEVSTGATIAKAGSTGASTGTHLHYEKIVNGKSVNPMQKTNTNGIRIKAPNGTIVLVPQNRVNEALKNGGVRI
jgi:murein DD-endopeptidase MepM/ murein hydrolase activator NlpD